MYLVADRFAAHDGERVIDLATGAPVVLKIGTAGGVADQLRWTIRCDVLHTLHHRAIARLIDFGILGETRRFEAWGCAPGPSQHRDKLRSTGEAALRFFRAVAMTVDTPNVESLHDGPAGPVFLPGHGTGYPDGSSVPRREALRLDDCGVRLIVRSAVDALTEMFQTEEARRPYVSVLWGPRESGRTTAALELARTARLNGFVPVACPVLETLEAGLLDGRSLFVIGDASRSKVWQAWLQIAMRSPRPHVFLMLNEHECASIDGIRLKPLSAEALADAVFPAMGDPKGERRIRQAAASARGLPGRFVRLLWGADYDALRPAAAAVRAAEHAAVYGDTTDVDHPCVDTTRDEWPRPVDVIPLRQRMDIAVQDIARGRHAPGIRVLRQTVGALARRGHHGDALEGALALASALLRRGRARDTHAALEEARTYASGSGRDELLIDVATLSGNAWIDLARLDEAEAVLSTAVATARELRDVGRAATASMALARCLYWRGQYADASAALGPSAGGRRRHSLLAARIAIGQRDTSQALALVNAASATARSTHDASSTATAAYCAALSRTAIGDLDAAEQDLSEALTASRAARDPMRAIRVKLLQAEIERLRGRARAAAAHVKWTARVISAAPPLLRARWTLVSALLDNSKDTVAIMDQHVAATGLGALRLYAGGSSRASRAGDGADALVREVVAIVRACQTADDEASVLKGVCGRIRRQVHAAGVAFISAASPRCGVVQGDGARIDPGIAERAIAAAITIAPHRCDDCVEAAAPVQYGGVVIGAICARWTVGSTHDVARAAHVLEMAAAAAAPVLSAILKRRDLGVASTAGTELLGVTPVMNELRRSVQCAAVAPFAVLIDGESGSGKELVARAVHRLGPRRDRPLCTLNCAALPDDLIEAELFGHARGAFTGAVAERTGVFEEAHGGTLFLDEVGELSPRAQAKVLRVIQEGELRRVGETISRRTDARIIAATNRDLRKEVDNGRFRLDLLYRLDVIRITVPPLRDRREDLGLIITHFWDEATRRLGSRATLSMATVAALARYDWPGNVRELQNVLAALAVRAAKRGVVPPTALPAHFGVMPCEEIWTLADARRTFDERFIRAALVRTGGHQGRAAEELGVTRQGLTKLMTRLGIATDSEERRPTNDEPGTTNERP